MKIYTKGGDRGTTSLFGGKRVDKNTARIRAYGEVDELNSWIGTILADIHYSSSKSSLARQVEKLKVISSRQARTINGFDDISGRLTRIQNELFVLGSDLATPFGVNAKIPRVKKSFTTRLEKEIDKWSKDLPQLKNFILPGGSMVGSKLHMARTVVRRAERSIVDISMQEKINLHAQIYINRLSDWLFTLARYINKIEGGKEIIWKDRG